MLLERQRAHRNHDTEEVEEVYPEVVRTGDDGVKSVDYGRLTPILVEALKEQQALLDEQAEVLARLERAQQALLEKASSLEQLIGNEVRSRD
jgi:hypothetical protein